MALYCYILLTYNKTVEIGSKHEKVSIVPQNLSFSSAIQCDRSHLVSEYKVQSEKV